MALDIGASPGGWSRFMYLSMSCDTVFAVDPGCVACPPHRGGRGRGVVHWNVLGDEAIASLRRGCGRDGEALGGAPLLDYYVSDANLPQAQAVALLHVIYR